MSIGNRLRFEVFKRDNFTCQYCGRKTPQVVLEVDHINPRSAGGDDDAINLLTSCWECNSGKSDKPLTERISGEDPHDRAVMLLERERQLLEYEEVRRAVEIRLEDDWAWLSKRWRMSEVLQVKARAYLREFSVFDISDAIGLAIDKTAGRDPSCTKYFCGIIRNWREMGGRESNDRAHEEMRRHAKRDIR